MLEYERTWGDRRARARSAGDEARDSYYDVPPIHSSHWKWLVISYFYLGGLAAGSYVVSSIAEIVGGQRARRIVRACRQSVWRPSSRRRSSAASISPVTWMRTP